MARARLRTLFQNKKDWPETIKHLIWLEEHTCIRHNVAYTHHPNCYAREYPNTKFVENLAFLDIEATNLKADFGIVICWVIKPDKTKDVLKRCITPRELKTCLDRKVIEALIKVLPRFDRVIAHYGSRFDVPFLRSRALSLGLEFPEYKSLWQTDTWRIARNKLCISSNRLGNVANLLGIKEKKTPITSQHWIAALTGNKESLAYILRHCEIDVKILEQVYNRISEFAPSSKTSI